MSKRLLMGIALGLACAGAFANHAAATPDRNGDIVFQSNRAGSAPELYLMRADGTNLRRLTFNSAEDRVPAFSPDGRHVVFMSNRDGDDDLYVLDVATGATTQITNDAVRDDNPAFTADGEQIVWQRGSFLCPCSIWIANVDGSDARRVDTGAGNATQPAPAPHGNTLAFAGDADGSWSIYTVNFAGKS